MTDLKQPIVSDLPEILVVCTHNAGRSVAARVLLDHHGQGRVVVRSAGTSPGEQVNPAIARILSDRGLDVAGEHPKRLTDEAARNADIVITMGCGDSCPVYPGQRSLDWDLADPAGKADRRGPTDRRRDRTPSRCAPQRAWDRTRHPAEPTSFAP